MDDLSEVPLARGEGVEGGRGLPLPPRHLELLGRLKRRVASDAPDPVEELAATLELCVASRDWRRVDRLSEAPKEMGEGARHAPGHTGVLFSPSEEVGHLRTRLMTCWIDQVVEEVVSKDALAHLGEVGSWRSLDEVSVLIGRLVACRAAQLSDQAEALRDLGVLGFSERSESEEG